MNIILIFINLFLAANLFAATTTKIAKQESSAVVITCDGYTSNIPTGDSDLSQCPKILEKLPNPGLVYSKLIAPGVQLDGDALIAEADKRAAMSPPAVTDKHPDSHDYISYAPYYWPDPNQLAKPGESVTYIRKDGQRNDAQVKLGDAKNFQVIAESIVIFTKAYKLSNNPNKNNHINAAAKYLNTWFLDPKTKMNANFNNAQIIVGAASTGLDNNGKPIYGRPEGMVELRFIKNILESEKIISGANISAWDKTKHDAFVAWVSELYTWLKTSPIAIKERNRHNNQGLWYDIELGSVLLFLGKTSEAADLFNKAKKNRVEDQICLDGTMPREESRANPEMYRSFNLMAFCTLADLADQAGVKLFAYKPTDANPKSDRGGISTVLQRQMLLTGSGKSSNGDQDLDL